MLTSVCAEFSTNQMILETKEKETAVHVERVS